MDIFPDAMDIALMPLQCITPTIGLVADQTPDHFVSTTNVSIPSYAFQPSYNHWMKEIETREKEMEAREKQLEAREKQIEAREQESPTLKQITPIAKSEIERKRKENDSQSITGGNMQRKKCKATMDWNSFRY